MLVHLLKQVETFAVAENHLQQTQMTAREKDLRVRHETRSIDFTNKNVHFFFTVLLFCPLFNFFLFVMISDILAVT